MDFSSRMFSDEDTVNAFARTLFYAMKSGCTEWEELSESDRYNIWGQLAEGLIASVAPRIAVRLLTDIADNAPDYTDVIDGEWCFEDDPREWLYQHANKIADKFWLEHSKGSDDTK